MSLKTSIKQDYGVPQFKDVDAGWLGNNSLPLTLKPSQGKLDARSWALENCGTLKAALLEHGGLLLRGFDFQTIGDFEDFMKNLFGELLEYRERSSPRNRVEGNIYTSTEYPADQAIFLHNENSYQRVFPLKIGFFCAIPATHGGQTPIADVRNVYARVPEEIREVFDRKQVMYVRNFCDGIGLSWQTVFQTDSKAEVETYCRRSGIRVEWKSDGGLRTRQVRPAIARHPTSGEYVWFNHATFFHITTLPGPIAEMLLSEFAEEDLPSNTYYGDGSPIPSKTLSILRKIYQEATITFDWEKGDLLILENMLVAHGRAPFGGQRKIVVGMAEPYSLNSA